MEQANIKYRIDYISLMFTGFNDDAISKYVLQIICHRTDGERECGLLLFESADCNTWKCTRRDNELCNLKLDNIFTDSMLTRMISEKLSKHFTACGKIILQIDA